MLIHRRSEEAVAAMRAGGREMGYESKIKNKEADDLFDAIMSITSREECYKFFEDLCTVKEIKAMAQRYGVAKLLLDRKTYSEIEEATGASTATISRINRTLQYGADGYTSVIGRMNEKTRPDSER